MSLLSIEDIRELCQRFDDENGYFPEHESEGYAVYQFIVNEVEGKQQEKDEK